MLRTILVAIGVSVMVLGGILPAHGDDRDDKDDKGRNGNKTQHQAILNAVNSGSAQHGQLSNVITALSGGHQAILDAVNGGTSSSNTAHTTLQGEHAAQNAAHSTQTTQHNNHDANQTTQHDELKQKIDNLSAGGDHRGLPQAWDKTLPANDPGGACPSNSSRFTCVMGGAAVRDNETGLVWEQSPGDTNNDGVITPVDAQSWPSATFHCARRSVGGRKGWRLPSFAELASLIDPNASSAPFLPAGHPFMNVQSSLYWSASSNFDFPSAAWVVDFLNGSVFSPVKNAPPTQPFAWCVRGGMNADQY